MNENSNVCHEDAGALLHGSVPLQGRWTLPGRLAPPVNACRGQTGACNTFTAPLRP